MFNFIKKLFKTKTHMQVTDRQDGIYYSWN